MVDAAKLSGLAAGEIAKLEADGIILTAEEIVRINALAWNVESPSTRLELSKGVPVAVGGVSLWPLTLEAYAWLQSCLEHVNTVDGENRITAYAMAHCYDDNKPYDALGGLGVKAAIRWSHKLKCTPDALCEAMAQVIQQSETEEVPDEKDHKPQMGIGDISARLTALTGQTPAEIESGMCVSHAFRILEFTLSAQEQATGGKGKGKGVAYIRAEKAIGAYLLEIRKGRETDG